jgi:hypothetical protein
MPPAPTAALNDSWTFDLEIRSWTRMNWQRRQQYLGPVFSPSASKRWTVRVAPPFGLSGVSDPFMLRMGVGYSFDHLLHRPSPTSCADAGVAQSTVCDARGALPHHRLRFSGLCRFEQACHRVWNDD